ncbi:MAG: MBL fold metallo-hydrolase [Clostridia bacterium]|nr:MBL fold metallo-hydrolase [Clostridia bacterium]
MNILCIPTGVLGTNTYIVYRESGTPEKPADCVVIDPAASKPVLKKLRELGLHCTHILLTHGHFDHIMGVAKLREEEGAQVFIHNADAGALEGGEASLAYMAGTFVTNCEVDKRLEDGDAFTAAGLEFSVIATPGHTPGGVCYVIESEKVIFSGDTLFRLSVGRTDLRGGDSMQLYESIAYRLFTLSGDYRVFPGHEEPTTLDFERKHNPFMRSGGAF